GASAWCTARAWRRGRRVGSAAAPASRQKTAAPARRLRGGQGRQWASGYRSTSGRSRKAPLGEPGSVVVVVTAGALVLVTPGAVVVVLAGNVVVVTVTVVVGRGDVVVVVLGIVNVEGDGLTVVVVVVVA